MPILLANPRGFCAGVDRAIAIVERAHKRARQILKENESALHQLAEHLLERETITGEEFMDMLKKVAPAAAMKLNS